MSNEKPITKPSMPAASDAPVVDEMAKLRAELAAANAKLEEQKRAATARAPERRSIPRDGGELDEEFDEAAFFSDDGNEFVINVSGSPAKFNIDGQIHVLKPKQSVRINRAYTTEVKGEGQGEPLKPVVMRLTGDRVVPAWHPDARGHENANAARRDPLEYVPFDNDKIRQQMLARR